MRRAREAEVEESAQEQLLLEPPDGPLLLRFVETSEGPQAVFAEEDPTPAECAERYLLQSQQDGKRQRRDGGQASAQAEDERSQALLESQRNAMEGLRRATTVSELLQRNTWGQDGSEQLRFLHLHPAVQAPSAPEEALALVREREAALAPWPQKLREAADVLAKPQQHTELEGVLRFLRRHWLVHCVNGRYLVELWNEDNMTEAAPKKPPIAAKKPKGSGKAEGKDAKAPDPLEGLNGKYLAALGQNPDLGACLSFPHEIGRLVEWRHRLSVQVHPLRATSSVPDAPAPEAALVPPAALSDPGLSRGEAMHAVLTEAQEVLIDHCAFRRFREGLAKGDAARWLRWHVLRASSSEIALAVPVGTGAHLMRVIVAFGGSHGKQDSRGGAGNKRDVWRWFGEAAELRLRELFLFGPDPKTGETPAKAPPADLFEDFTRWLEPQLSAAVAYAKA